MYHNGHLHITAEKKTITSQRTPVVEGSECVRANVAIPSVSLSAEQLRKFGKQLRTICSSLLDWTEHMPTIFLKLSNNPLCPFNAWEF